VNYYLNETADEYEFGIATSKYQPFFPKTLVKLLDEPSALSFVHHLPRMDGDIELYPLYTAFARAAYPSAYYDPYDTSGKSAVACDSYDKIRRLVEGDSDIAFMANVTEEDYKTAADAGLELNLLPIGKEALVFFVNSKNRVNGLSQEEALQIYSGEIWNWSFVKDGKASGAITPYQLGGRRGETEAFKKIMSGVKLAKPPELLYYDDKLPYLFGRAAEYKNRKNALGIAYRFLVEETLNEAHRKGIKLLKIDGVEPSIENISSGAYPYSNYFYAVTIKNRPVATAIKIPFDRVDVDTKTRIENTQKLLDWILSEQGQSLVEKTGYAPLKYGISASEAVRVPVF
jgi:phosphate transport system substrate-binding protein